MALDLTAPPPPKTTAPPRKTPPNAVKRPSKHQERQEGVNGVFQLAAGLCLIFRQPADAGACATHGPPISVEVANLAEANDGIAKIVDYITAVGPYAGLLAVILPFGLQIAVNHNKLPAEPLAQFGVKSPQALAAQAAADAMRQQAAMMKEQQAAEAEMAALSAAMATPNGANPA